MIKRRQPSTEMTLAPTVNAMPALTSPVGSPDKLRKDSTCSSHQGGTNARLLPLMVTPKEIASMLGISLATLRRWQHGQLGLPCARFSRNVTRYKLSDIEEWIRARAEVPKK